MTDPVKDFIVAARRDWYVSLCGAAGFHERLTVMVELEEGNVVVHGPRDAALAELTGLDAGGARPADIGWGVP